MHNRIGIIFVRIGGLLLISAVLLFFHNQYESLQAKKESNRLLNDLQTIITRDSITGKNNDMTGIELEGYEYIGYIAIPTLNIKLPVMAEWDYNRLRIAPSRHYGSIRTNDLVIAAHNYSSHFGNLKQLVYGDEITFTEVGGDITKYSVEKSSVVKPTKVENILNSEYDLVLYTCTAEGITRFIVFANEVFKN